MSKSRSKTAKKNKKNSQQALEKKGVPIDRDAKPDLADTAVQLEKKQEPALIYASLALAEVSKENPDYKITMSNLCHSLIIKNTGVEDISQNVIGIIKEKMMKQIVIGKFTDVVAITSIIIKTIDSAGIDARLSLLELLSLAYRFRICANILSQNVSIILANSDSTRVETLECEEDDNEYSILHQDWLNAMIMDRDGLEALLKKAKMVDVESYEQTQESVSRIRRILEEIHKNWFYAQLLENQFEKMEHQPKYGIEEINIILENVKKVANKYLELLGLITQSDGFSLEILSQKKPVLSDLYIKSKFLIANILSLKSKIIDVNLIEDLSLEVSNICDEVKSHSDKHKEQIEVICLHLQARIYVGAYYRDRKDLYKREVLNCCTKAIQLIPRNFLSIWICLVELLSAEADNYSTINQAEYMKSTFDMLDLITTKYVVVENGLLNRNLAYYLPIVFCDLQSQLINISIENQKKNNIETAYYILLKLVKSTENVIECINDCEIVIPEDHTIYINLKIIKDKINLIDIERKSKLLHIDTDKDVAPIETKDKINKNTSSLQNLSVTSVGKEIKVEKKSNKVVELKETVESIIEQPEPAMVAAKIALSAALIIPLDIKLILSNIQKSCEKKCSEADEVNSQTISELYNNLTDLMARENFIAVKTNTTAIIDSYNEDAMQYDILRDFLAEVYKLRSWACVLSVIPDIENAEKDYLYAKSLNHNDHKYLHSINLPALNGIITEYKKEKIKFDELKITDPIEYEYYKNTIEYLRVYDKKSFKNIFDYIKLNSNVRQLIIKKSLSLPEVVVELDQFYISLKRTSEDYSGVYNNQLTIKDYCKERNVRTQNTSVEAYILYTYCNSQLLTAKLKYFHRPNANNIGNQVVNMLKGLLAICKARNLKNAEFIITCNIADIYAEVYKQLKDQADKSTALYYYNEARKILNNSYTLELKVTLLELMHIDALPTLEQTESILTLLHKVNEENTIININDTVINKNIGVEVFDVYLEIRKIFIVLISKMIVTGDHEYLSTITMELVSITEKFMLCSIPFGIQRYFLSQLSLSRTQEIPSAMTSNIPESVVKVIPSLAINNISATSSKGKVNAKEEVPSEAMTALRIAREDKPNIRELMNNLVIACKSDSETIENITSTIRDRLIVYFANKISDQEILLKRNKLTELQKEVTTIIKSINSIKQKNSVLDDILFRAYKLRTCITLLSDHTDLPIANDDYIQAKALSSYNDFSDPILPLKYLEESIKQRSRFDEDKRNGKLTASPKKNTKNFDLFRSADNRYLVNLFKMKFLEYQYRSLKDEIDILQSMYMHQSVEALISAFQFLLSQCLINKQFKDIDLQENMINLTNKINKTLLLIKLFNAEILSNQVKVCNEEAIFSALDIALRYYKSITESILKEHSELNSGMICYLKGELYLEAYKRNKTIQTLKESANNCYSIAEMYDKNLYILTLRRESLTLMKLSELKDISFIKKHNFVKTFKMMDTLVKRKKPLDFEDNILERQSIMRLPDVLVDIQESILKICEVAGKKNDYAFVLMLTKNISVYVSQAIQIIEDMVGAIIDTNHPVLIKLASVYESRITADVHLKHYEDAYINFNTLANFHIKDEEYLQSLALRLSLDYEKCNLNSTRLKILKQANTEVSTITDDKKPVNSSNHNSYDAAKTTAEQKKADKKNHNEERQKARELEQLTRKEESEARRKLIVDEDIIKKELAEVQINQAKEILESKNPDKYSIAIKHYDSAFASWSTISRFGLDDELRQRKIDMALNLAECYAEIGEYKNARVQVNRAQNIASHATTESVKSFIDRCPELLNKYKDVISDEKHVQIATVVQLNNSSTNVVMHEVSAFILDDKPLAKITESAQQTGEEHKIESEKLPSIDFCFQSNTSQMDKTEASIVKVGKTKVKSNHGRTPKAKTKSKSPEIVKKNKLASVANNFQDNIENLKTNESSSKQAEQNVFDSNNEQSVLSLNLSTELSTQVRLETKESSTSDSSATFSESIEKDQIQQKNDDLLNYLYTIISKETLLALFKFSEDLKSKFNVTFEISGSLIFKLIMLYIHPDKNFAKDLAVNDIDSYLIFAKQQESKSLEQDYSDLANIMDKIKINNRKFVNIRKTNHFANYTSVYDEKSEVSKKTEKKELPIDLAVKYSSYSEKKNLIPVTNQTMTFSDKPSEKLGAISLRLSDNQYIIIEKKNDKLFENCEANIFGLNELPKANDKEVTGYFDRLYRAVKKTQNKMKLNDLAEIALSPGWQLHYLYQKVNLRQEHACTSEIAQMFRNNNEAIMQPLENYIRVLILRNNYSAILNKQIPGLTEQFDGSEIKIATAEKVLGEKLLAFCEEYNINTQSNNIAKVILGYLQIRLSTQSNVDTNTILSEMDFARNYLLMNLQDNNYEFLQDEIDDEINQLLYTHENASDGGISSLQHTVLPIPYSVDYPSILHNTQKYMNPYRSAYTQEHVSDQHIEMHQHQMVLSNPSVVSRPATQNSYNIMMPVLMQSNTQKSFSNYETFNNDMVIPRMPIASSSIRHPSHFFHGLINLGDKSVSSVSSKKVLPLQRNNKSKK